MWQRHRPSRSRPRPLLWPPPPFSASQSSDVPASAPSSDSSPLIPATPQSPQQPHDPSSPFSPSSPSPSLRLAQPRPSPPPSPPLPPPSPSLALSCPVRPSARSPPCAYPPPLSPLCGAPLIPSTPIDAQQLLPPSGAFNDDGWVRGVYGRLQPRGAALYLSYTAHLLLPTQAQPTDEAREQQSSSEQQSTDQQAQQQRDKEETEQLWAEQRRREKEGQEGGERASPPSHPSHLHPPCRAQPLRQPGECPSSPPSSLASASASAPSSCSASSSSSSSASPLCPLLLPLRSADRLSLSLAYPASPPTLPLPPPPLSPPLRCSPLSVPPSAAAAGSASSRAHPPLLRSHLGPRAPSLCTPTSSSQLSLLTEELTLSFLSLPRSLHQLRDDSAEAAPATSPSTLTPCTQTSSALPLPLPLPLPLAVPFQAVNGVASLRRRGRGGGEPTSSPRLTAPGASPPLTQQQPQQSPAKRRVRAASGRRRLAVSGAGGGGGEERDGGAPFLPSLHLALPSDVNVLTHPPLHCMAADDLAPLYEAMHSLITRFTSASTTPHPATHHCSPYHLRLLLLAHRSLHAYTQREGLFARRSEASKQVGCSEDILAWVERTHSDTERRTGQPSSTDGREPQLPTVDPMPIRAPRASPPLVPDPSDGRVALWSEGAAASL